MTLVLRRLLRAILTLLLLLAAALALLRTVPGGPFDQERQAAPEVVAALNAHYGIDLPFQQQYLRYLRAALHGDLGPSFYYVDQSVTDIVTDSLQVTLLLASGSLVVAALLALLVAYAAVRSPLPLRAALRFASSLLAATPKFVLAPVLVLVFALALGWFPAGGLDHGWSTLVLPIVALALPQAAILSRSLIAAWLQALKDPAVCSAGLRGLGRDRLLLRHAGRLLLPRAMAYLTPIAIALFTGSAVVETVFSLPGLGRALVQAAQNRDYALTLGIVLTSGSLILLINMVFDAVQAALRSSRDAADY